MPLEIQQTIRQATEFAAQQIRTCLPVWIEDSLAAGPRPESPIEYVFETWWIALRSVGSVMCGRLRLIRQFAVPELGYRLDFIVTDGDKDPAFPLVAIELDGHAFHERTRDQVRQRDERDRRLQQVGWRVFHFSGSELMADPVRCVRDVQAWCEVAILDLEYGGR